MLFQAVLVLMAFAAVEAATGELKLTLSAKEVYGGVFLCTA